MAEDSESKYGAPGAAAQGALGAASRAKADAYLNEQMNLAKLQSQNLTEQNAYEISHLRWRRFNDQMAGALQIMLVAVGALIVFAIGAAMWSAYEDNGLVIEAFSVPPDLAAKGLTGEVIASKILDRLSAFQAQTGSGRASASYANNWGNDIKVQIPDTGVSIGEFNLYLHQWLGHETRISGEIYRTPAGIAMAARAGSDGSPVFTGSEADLDKLIEQAAEHVYRSTQPYRYAVYLYDHKRYAEDKAVLQHIISTGSPLDRAWAYIGMNANAEEEGDFRAAAAWLHKAVETDPALVLPYNDLVNDENTLQHDEQALAAARLSLDAVGRGDPSMSRTVFAWMEPAARFNIALLTGDFGEALKHAREGEAAPDFIGSLEAARLNEVQTCGMLHDPACLAAASASLADSTDPDVLEGRTGTLQLAELPLERWQDILKPASAFYAALLKGGAATRVAAMRDEAPVYAIAAAHAGDLATAHRLIDTTPPDCVICLRMHGQIDAVEKNWGGAGYWFARAVRAAPSVPFGYADWGAMLLAKGDLDAAIAKFTLANEKGPHFADPLEMWGEALMLQNRSDLALAKFAEADKYAPNWGRLHLKWGEALAYSGDADGAKAQFVAASNLDLSAADRAELARQRAKRG
jgi:hypothetical protein